MEQQQASFVCDWCGRSYATEAGLKQHKRRYCKPDAALRAEDGFVCVSCARRFGSKAGLSLHRKSAHPAEYQADLEAEDGRKRTKFSDLEMREIAAEELRNLNLTFINQHLSTCFGCSAEVIKNLRRTQRYRTIRDAVVLEGRDDAGGAVSLPPPRSPSSPDKVRTGVPKDRSSPSASTTIATSEDVVTEGVLVPVASVDFLLGTEPLAGPSYSCAPSALPPVLPSSPSSSSSSSSSSSLSSSPFSASLHTLASSSASSPAASPLTPGPSTDPAHADELVPRDPVHQLIIDLLSHSDVPDAERSTARLVLSGPEDARVHLESLCRSLLSGVSPRPQRDGRLASHGGRVPLRPRFRRAHLYKRVQELYRSDRSYLAARILDGLKLDAPSVHPRIEDIEDEYARLFGAAPDPHDLPLSDPLSTIEGLFAPVGFDDLSRCLASKMSGASGPDGMTLRDLRQIRPARILLLYNLMLFTGVCPPILKTCRTTLIPKRDYALDRVDSWRPITVAPLLLRIFHRILAARLSCLPLQFSQRGFRAVDGTMANTFILQAIIKDCRSSARPYQIASLDLKRAFDTVPHAVISRALLRLGVDARLARYLIDSLSESVTTISVGGKSTAPVRMERGVKQGDPISPILFNCVIDELFHLLHGLPAGLPLGDLLVNSLGYADDIVLLAASKADLQILVNKCHMFFRERSMTLNPDKCAHLPVRLVPAKKKLYVASNCRLYIDNFMVPLIDAEGRFKYLGHSFGYMGSGAPSLDGLGASLARLSSAPLKPFQKFDILLTYLLPRFLYPLQAPNISAAVLERSDKMVRRFVKKTLHLPLQTPNAALYADRRGGGLGVPCFSLGIPSILLGRLRKLAIGPDPHVAAALESAYCHRLMERLEDATRLCGVGVSQRGYWRTKWENCCSGAGLPSHSSASVTSSWLISPPPHWSGSDYVSAVQLRTNTLPTRGGLHNVRVAAGLKRCRAGCDRVETVSHILQKCPITHLERVRRHDHAVSTLARLAAKHGWAAQVEPHIRCSSGLLRKPDLIFAKGNSVVIADVAVCWEAPNPLRVQFEHKIATYSDPAFVDSIKKLYPGSDIYVRALVLGARGTWCHLNDSLIQQLGLRTADCASLISGVLRGGILTHRAFGRKVWDRS